MVVCCGKNSMKFLICVLTTRGRYFFSLRTHVHTRSCGAARDLSPRLPAVMCSLQKTSHACRENSPLCERDFLKLGWDDAEISFRTLSGETNDATRFARGPGGLVVKKLA